MSSVGRSYYSGSDTLRSWIYEDGTYTFLRSLPGDKNVAVEAINDGGDIVGRSSKDGSSTAVIWPADDRSPRPLSGPAGLERPRVSAISNSGGIVGSASEPGGYAQPVYWPDPNAEGKPLEGSEQTGSAVDVAGRWAVGNLRGSGTRWDLRDGTQADVANDRYVKAVNSAGDVGSVGQSAGDAGAMIHRPDGSTLELLAPDGGTTTANVKVVFERGADHTAAGEYSDDEDNSPRRPVLWTC